MNDDARLEQLFGDGLRELAPPHAPDWLRNEAKSQSSQMRPRLRWLALMKEPPMRISSSLAVGSPTVRGAAILAATLLIGAAIAGAGIAGTRLLAADGTIVVDQSGGGDYRTIAEAVAAADDGDIVLVRPGTYVEAVTIDEDITLRGDGPLGDIVITAPEGGPTSPIGSEGAVEPYAVLISDSVATLEGLTFRGIPSEVIVSGGAPTLQQLRFEGTGTPYLNTSQDLGGSSILVISGSTAAIRDNDIVGGGPIRVFDDSSPLIESNNLSGGAHIFGGFGDAAVIRGNTIDATPGSGIVTWSAKPMIEDNTILDPGQSGVEVWDGAPIIRRNTVAGADFAGILASDPAAPTISENVLTDNRLGISWQAPAGTIHSNTIEAGGTGLSIGGGAPDVSGNSVRHASDRGLAIGFGASPTLTENLSCDNGENLWVAEGANPAIDASNEICADARAE